MAFKLDDGLTSQLVTAAVWCGLVLVVIYLYQINRLLSGAPEDVQRLSPKRWTEEMLLEAYNRLEATPITTDTYVKDLPPKLERRYIVTGGSGQSCPFA
jgi:hypothetical protein